MKINRRDTLKYLTLLPLVPPNTYIFFPRNDRIVQNWNPHLCFWRKIYYKIYLTNILTKELNKLNKKNYWPKSPVDAEWDGKKWKWYEIELVTFVDVKKEYMNDKVLEYIGCLLSKSIKRKLKNKQCNKLMIEVSENNTRYIFRAIVRI